MASSSMAGLVFQLAGAEGINDVHKGHRRSVARKADRKVVDMRGEGRSAVAPCYLFAKNNHVKTALTQWPVFAAADEAFARLPEETITNLLKPENRKQLHAILTYHIVPGTVKAADVVKISSARTVQGQSVRVNAHGGNVMIDNANVVKTDIHCSNRVVHVIDSVILPMDEIAEAAGLTDTLKSEGPFTIFAPTDGVFEKLPEDTVESLLKPEGRDRLQTILTYHVVPANVLAEDVVKLRQRSTARM